MTWVPVLALAMYVVTSMIGLLSIPWTMTAELFPIEIRGIAHSFTNGFANLLMFFSIQSYYSLTKLFGGVSGIQYFFAVISVGGAVYSYIFLPETHMKKLSQIQEYFTHNLMYLGQKKKPRTSSNVRRRATNRDIVQTEDRSQNQVLLNQWYRTQTGTPLYRVPYFYFWQRKIHIGYVLLLLWLIFRIIQ